MMELLEMQISSLSQEDTLEEEMVAHSSIVAWKIRRARQTTVHGVTKSQTQLSD